MLIQIILVSDDQNYGYAVLNDLTTMGRQLAVTEMNWSEMLFKDFELMLARSGYSTPTIVMIDFGFVQRDYDRMVERIGSVKDRMAIECIILRPPVDAVLFEGLRRHGLQVFEGVSTPAEAYP